MTTPLAPIDVVRHWPFVRRNLRLELKVSTLRALELLARLQLAAEGDPVELGNRRICAAGYTPGEAGRVRMTFRALEEHRVVFRHRGRGRRGDAWSFRPDVGHWRAMPWIWGGPPVEIAICACICRAPVAFAARFPGHSLEQFGNYRLLESDHFGDQGFYPVETRGNRDERAATPPAPGLLPVETRGKRSAAGVPLLSIERESLSLPVKRGSEGGEQLANAIAQATGRPVLGKYRADLDRIAAGAPDVDGLARELAGTTGLWHVGTMVDRARELASRPAPPAAESFELREARARVRKLEGDLATARKLGEIDPDAEPQLVRARTDLDRLLTPAALG